jgi:hypothetical protein
MLIDNPIWFREQRARQVQAGRRRWWRRAAEGGLFVVWLLPLCLWLLIGGLSEHVHFTWREFVDAVGCSAFIGVYLQIMYVSFRSLVAGAGCIARERELQTLDTLLSTPLELGRLVRGKFAVVAVPQFIELTAALPLTLMMLAWSSPQFGLHAEHGLQRIGGLYLLSIVCITFFTCLGMALSATATNASRATSRAVLLGIVIFLGTYLGDMMLAGILREEQFVGLLYLNPYAALTSVLYGSEMGARDCADVWSYGVWPVTIMAYLVMARALASCTVRRLARVVSE